jgi:hypothetical protein
MYSGGIFELSVAYTRTRDLEANIGTPSSCNKKNVLDVIKMVFKAHCKYIIFLFACKFYFFPE